MGTRRLQPWRDLGLVALVGAGAAALYARGADAAAVALAAAFVVALGVEPLVARFVRDRGALRLPGGRSRHTRATPLLGGVGLYVPLAVVSLVGGVLGDGRSFGFLAGATVVFLCGACDDLHGVRPRVKILAQVVAALCLVAGGHRLEAIGVEGAGQVSLGSLEVVVIAVWVVVASNAFNLSDGIDGLAGTLAVVGAVGALASGADPLRSVVLAGAALGFLRYNLPTARIFLGDSGSLLVGFTLAALALEAPTASNLPVAYGLLAYSLGDTALAVLRRFLRGKPLFAGDRSHVHHKLHEHLGSPWTTLGACAGVAAVHLLVARALPGVAVLPVAALLWAGLAAGLMVAGRVRMGALLEQRRPFQRLHLARAYVSGRLRLAEHLADVEDSLRRLVEDVGLASLVVGPIRLLGRPPSLPSIVTATVPLRSGDARWSYAPADAQGAFDDELRAVVCELVREADVRIATLTARPPAPRLALLRSASSRPAAAELSRPPVEDRS